MMIINRKLGLALLTLFATSHLSALAQGQGDADPIVKAAVDGVFEAFETHPLVGLGEAHGVAQVLDFYTTLIRDSRFADEVGNVVVEFGGAAHQEVIDRYVSGEVVPYPELRRVWTDTVGWVPTVPSEGYARFFAEVRHVNRVLAEEARIKVWLGEPPINWSTIETREEWRTILDTRESHAAEVIIRNILEKDRKALVIYGGAHFKLTQPWEEETRAMVIAADPGGPMSQGGGATLRDVVEKDYPGSFFIAQTYRGFVDEECTRRVEQVFVNWQMPALVVSVPGTTLEQAMRRCLPAFDAGRISFPPSIPEPVQERVRAIVQNNADRDRPLLSGALLIHGPAADLTVATPFLDFALDEEWRAELNRRNELITGRSLPPDWGRGFPSSPVPYGWRD